MPEKSSTSPEEQLRQYYRDYRKKNPEKVKGHVRKYQEKNAAAIKERQKAYRAKLGPRTDADRERDRIRYSRNREATLARKATYREANRERVNQWARESRNRHLDKRRENVRRRREGRVGGLQILKTDWFTLLERQENRCATCDRTEGLVIDHCHDSGVIRGLLCRRCNMIAQDICVVRAVLAYMEAHVEAA